MIFNRVLQSFIFISVLLNGSVVLAQNLIQDLGFELQKNRSIASPWSIEGSASSGTDRGIGRSTTTPAASSSSIQFGVHMGNNPGDHAQEFAMNVYLGKKHTVVGQSSHFDWCTNSGTVSSIMNQLTTIWNDGSVPMFGIAPLPFPALGSQPDADVANGLYDGCIDIWAKVLKSWLSGPDGVYSTADDRRLYLRPWQEMNGNWFPWAPHYSGTTTKPQDFVNMWRHFYTRFVSFNGIDTNHVQWVWCPNARDFGSTMESNYPGDNYVQWLTTDGYAEASLNPAVIFDTAFSRLQKISPHKPKGISEFGVLNSATIAQKNQFITDTYAYAVSKRLKQIIYYNENTGTFPAPPNQTYSVFGCASLRNCPAGSFGEVLNPGGDGSVTIGGVLYRYFSAYKRAILSSSYISTTPGNLRLLTNQQFMGQ
jgi:mannan endo-1,4-beta-mannosidase